MKGDKKTKEYFQRFHNVAVGIFVFLIRILIINTNAQVTKKGYK